MAKTNAKLRPVWTDLKGPHGLCRSRPGGSWSYRISLHGSGQVKVATKTSDNDLAARIAEQAHLDNAAKKDTNLKLGVEAMRFDEACDFWMADEAPRMRERDLPSQVAWLKKQLGRKYLHMLRSSDLTNLRNARMATVRSVIRRVDGELVAVALRDAKGQPRLVSHATVNNTLRLFSRIVNHAANKRDAEVRRFKLADFLIKIARAKPRALTEEQELAMFGALRHDYVPVVLMAIISGLRATENLIRKDQVDFANSKLIDVVSKTHPAGRDVPLSEDELTIIRREYFRNDNDTDYVFTYVAEATRRVGRTDREVVAGRRYPTTYAGWKAQWKLMKKLTGLTNRRIHDLRHTAACRALARTGNLKAVSEMLGHSSIKITAETYAHASEAMIQGAKQGTASAHAMGLLVPQLVPASKKLAKTP